MAVTKEKLGAGRKSGVETPPEGGWGWMIVAGCFLATICTRAVTRCVSMFLVEFQLHFEKDYSTIAWIHSLMDSVTMLCAPLGGFLGGRLSCRVTVMLGGLLSATGLVISSFVSSPECLYVFMGILTGLGFALSYTPALAMVGRYFSERKALAYGIALSGTGIGTFILAPVVHLLIEHYSWRGALLILGGFVSNLCVCGALMKPLETRGEKEHLSENYMTDKDQDCMTTVLDSKDTELAPADGSSVEPKQLETDNLKDTQQILISSGALRNTGLENDKLSEGNIALLTDLTLVESLFFTNRRTGTVLEEIKRSECKPAGGSTGKDMRLLENVILNKSADKDALTDEPQLTEATDSFQLTVIRPPGPFISTKTSSRCPFSCLLNPGQEFGFLLIPDFLVLSVSFLFMGYGCSAPAVYLVPYAVSVGVEHQHAAFLMSIFGVSVIVGNITFGLITDRSCLKRYRMVCYMLLIAIEGFWCMFLPLLQSFPLLASFSVLYGYIEGAYVALIPVVTSDVVGPTYLTSALGVVYFLHGIPYLISPPIGGWLVDRTGNYMATFFLSGVCFMLSSVVLITTMLVRHYQRSKCISAAQFGPSGAAAAAQQGI